ncbi:MAG: SRPBCC domain-containing protein [Terracidiphilus sp.]
MSTITFSGISARTPGEWKRYLPTTQPPSISVAASVNADRHRIFQALTVPEYIEAWFSPPGAIEGSTEVFAGTDSFLASYVSAAGERAGVLCSYKVCRRGKLLFTWEHNAEAEPSVVKIRMLGDFGRTTVDVTHAGLALSDQQWHKKLWESSLGKLAKLFGTDRN